MKTIQISLNSIDKVKSFVNDITKFDYDFDLVSGRYVIDAKSIMGIFSLDLSKPIDLNIHAEDNAEEVLAWYSLMSHGRMHAFFHSDQKIFKRHIHRMCRFLFHSSFTMITSSVSSAVFISSSIFSSRFCS